MFVQLYFCLFLFLSKSTSKEEEKCLDSWKLFAVAFCLGMLQTRTLTQRFGHHGCYKHLQLGFYKRGRKRHEIMGTWHCKEQVIMGFLAGEKLRPEVLLLALAHLNHILIILTSNITGKSSNTLCTSTALMSWKADFWFVINNY